MEQSLPNGVGGAVKGAGDVVRDAPALGGRPRVSSAAYGSEEPQGERADPVANRRRRRERREERIEIARRGRDPREVMAKPVARNLGHQMDAATKPTFHVLLHLHAGDVARILEQVDRDPRRLQESPSILEQGEARRGSVALVLDGNAAGDAGRGRLRAGKENRRRIEARNRLGSRQERDGRRVGDRARSRRRR